MDYNMSNLFKNIPHKLFISPDKKLLHRGLSNEINYTKDLFSIGDFYCGAIKHNGGYRDIITEDNIRDDLLLYYYYCYYYNKTYLITKNEEDYTLWKLKYGI
jgi:hypothetical protein